MSNKNILSHIKSRVDPSSVSTELNEEEKSKKRYEQLKEEIKARTIEEAINRLELAKALYEIKEKKLYLFDNYKNFYEFCMDYKFSRTMIYKYIKIASSLEKKQINEHDVIQGSINGIIKNINKKNSKNSNSVKAITISINLNDAKKHQEILDNKDVFKEFLIKQILANWVFDK